MANNQSELDDMLQMLEKEIPGFQAGWKLLSHPMAGAETIDACQFIATVDEVVFAFEDRLHLGNVTLTDEHTIHAPGRLVAH